MSTVKARLDKLEKEMGANGPGLLVVARCGPDENEVDALLANRGIDADDPRHTVVILQNIFEDRDGDFVDEQTPAEIMYVMERK